MILLVTAASGSELPGLSDGRPEPVRAGSAAGPELVPPAAAVMAAQGDDAGCSGGCQVQAWLLRSPVDDIFTASFDVTRADAAAEVAQVTEEHPGGVVLEE